MNELKDRLEYLETVTKSSNGDSSLLEQVDSIESALNSMLDIHRSEADRLVHEVTKETQRAGVDDFGDINLEISDSEPSAKPGLSTEVKSGIVVSRLAELSDLTKSLEMELPLQIPEPVSQPNIEDLVLQAQKLGKEFDDLTIRSTELTQKLTQRISDENQENGRN